jgi:hypothetical protein
VSARKINHLAEEDRVIVRTPPECHSFYLVRLSTDTGVVAAHEADRLDPRRLMH